MNLLIKELSIFGGPQLVFFRALGSLFFTLPYLKYHNIPILGNQKVLLISRGVAGLTSMGLFFISVAYLPIGTAVSLRYLSPIFAAILAFIILKEKIRSPQWLFFGISFLGVVLVKGFDANMDTFGLILILLSAFFSGIVYVLINKIGKGDHPVVVVNYFMCISVIIGGIGSIFYWQTPVGWQWFFLLSLGGFGYAGQLFMTKAFQTQETNKIVPFKYLEVVFTVIFGILIFKDKYPLMSFMGTFLVILGLVLNVLYVQNYKKRNQEKSSLK